MAAPIHRCHRHHQRQRQHNTDRSDGTGLAVGMGVSGAGIRVGATLASRVGGTSWVLSIAAAAGSGVALTFTNIIVDLVHSAMQPNVS